MYYIDFIDCCAINTTVTTPYIIVYPRDRLCLETFVPLLFPCRNKHLTSPHEPYLPSVRALSSSLRNKRARLGTVTAMKDACLGHIDRYAEMYGQHMPHLNATYLYLGCMRVSR